MPLEMSDGAIMRGSIDSASISWFRGGRWLDRPDRGPLDEVREFASSVALMALLRRRRMRKAATSSTIRMNNAPPMIPPSSGVVSPLDDESDAADFAIAVGADVT
jgi:hypothetical protein